MNTINVLQESPSSPLRFAVMAPHPGVPSTRLSPPEAARTLRRLLEDRMQVLVLRGQVAAWLDPSCLRAWDDRELEEKVSDWIFRGMVDVVVSTRLVADSGGAGQEAPAAAPPAPPPPPPRGLTIKSFIALELVDDDGKPVPGEKYRIELPDGSVRTANLDANGKARVDDIDPPGTCKISFPDLDAADWKAA